jgi:hypothetical protein
MHPRIVLPGPLHYPIARLVSTERMIYPGAVAGGSHGSIDTTKGVAAVLASQRLIGLPETLAAIPAAAAVAGHILPFYLGFRGGKGTAMSPEWSPSFSCWSSPRSHSHRSHGPRYPGVCSDCEKGES